MLENVKSQYLVKLLFTFLLHKRKLRIVRYNKQLNYYLKVNIIMEKEMEMAKNIITQTLNIKENLKMERGMDMEKKIVLIIHLKENSKMENIGMEFTKKEIMILMRKDILQY